MAKLSALFVKSAPPGKHEDGNGLRLVKREDGGGQWVFRYTIHERRRGCWHLWTAPVLQGVS